MAVWARPVVAHGGNVRINGRCCAHGLLCWALIWAAVLPDQGVFLWPVPWPCCAAFLPTTAHRAGTNTALTLCHQGDGQDRRL